MKIKSITWMPKSRTLEIKYEDGVNGSIIAPQEWGEFRGTHESSDPMNGSGTLWEHENPHAYHVYTLIKENTDARNSLSQANWDRTYPR